MPTAFTLAVGLTVIVNVIGVPGHDTPALVYTGVTVTVAVTGEAVLLIAVNDPILPVPLAARPMLVLLLVQLYTVPATGPVIVTAAVDAPLQTVWFAIALTAGVGFTVIVNVLGVPGQPVEILTGVTVIVATTGVVPALVAVKLGILPVPAPPKPIEGWLFVHWKNTPDCEVVNVTGAVADPLHSTWLPGYGGFITGVGFTVIVKLTGAPLQLTPPLVKVGVTVIVAVTGTWLLLIAVKAGILPKPAEVNPMVVLLLVQLYVTVPPVLGLVKLTAAVKAPLHTVWFAGVFTTAVGLTVIVNVVGVPLQVPKLGVTVIVATTGAVPPLVAVKLGILPEPLAASPMEGWLLVQLNTVPGILELKLTAAVAVLLHTTWSLTGLIVGAGFTVIVKLIGVPVQVMPPLV